MPRYTVRPEDVEARGAILTPGRPDLHPAKVIDAAGAEVPICFYFDTDTGEVGRYDLTRDIPGPRPTDGGGHGGRGLEPWEVACLVIWETRPAPLRLEPINPAPPAEADTPVVVPAG